MDEKMKLGEGHIAKVAFALDNRLSEEVGKGIIAPDLGIETEVENVKQINSIIRSRISLRISIYCIRRASK